MSYFGFKKTGSKLEIKPSTEYAYLNNEEAMKTLVQTSILTFINDLDKKVDITLSELRNKCVSNTLIPLTNIPVGNSVINALIRKKVDEINAKVCKYVKVTFDEAKPTSLIVTVDLVELVNDIKF